MESSLQYSDGNAMHHAHTQSSENSPHEDNHTLSATASSSTHQSARLKEHGPTSGDTDIMITSTPLPDDGEEHDNPREAEETEETTQSEGQNTTYNNDTEFESETRPLARLYTEIGSETAELSGEEVVLDKARAVMPSVTPPGSPRLCSLCDEDRVPAVGHCTECDDDLCAACVSRHKRMSLAANHHINLFPLQHGVDGDDIPLAESLPRRQHLSRSETIATIERCQKHMEEKLRFFCKSCQRPVCRDCILTSHKQHVTEDLGDATLSARTELSEMMRQLEQKKHTLESYLHGFEDYKTQFEHHAGRVEDMMRTFYLDVQAAVDSSYQNLKENLEEIRQSELERIRNHELIVQNNVEDVNRLLGQQATSAESSILVLSQHEVVTHALKTLGQNIRLVQLGQGEFFISRNPRLTTVTQNLLSQVTFMTHNPPFQSSQQNAHGQTLIQEVKLRREVAFTIWEMNKSKSSVRSIVEASNGTVWVATPRSLLKVQNSVTKNSSNVPDDIANVVAGPGDKLLVSLGQGSLIKVYANGSWSSFASVPKGSSVLASRPFHHNLQVYVAVTPQLGTTKILSYSTDGQVCQQLKLPSEIFQQTQTSDSRRSSPEFKSTSSATISSGLALACMAVGIDGTLFLGDEEGERLLIVDGKGQLSGQYHGPDGQSGCQPRSLCVVGSGQVAMADSQRCTVELLSVQGKLLASLLSRDHFQDIGAPTAVSVDSKGRLWVGTSMGHVCAYSFLHTFPSPPITLPCP